LIFRWVCSSFWERLLCYKELSLLWFTFFNPITKDWLLLTGGLWFGGAVLAAVCLWLEHYYIKGEWIRQAEEINLFVHLPLAFAALIACGLPVSYHHCIDRISAALFISFWFFLGPRFYAALNRRPVFRRVVEWSPVEFLRRKPLDDEGSEFDIWY
jgi:hypothetical protein